MLRLNTRTLQRWTIVALLGTVGLTGCREEASLGSSPSNVSATQLAQGNTSLGDLAFRLIRQQIANAPTNSDAKLATLDGLRDAFVAAVDQIVSDDVAQNVPSIVQTLLDLARSGHLRQLTDDIGAMAHLLANDPADPQSKVLAALIALGNEKPPIDPTTAARLASRLVAYPEFSPLLQGISALVRANDGLDAGGVASAQEGDLLTPILGAASNALSNLATPAANAPLIGDEVVDTLLAPISLRGTVVGGPAWSVYLDANGNPRVATNRSGGLLAPFVDANHDGLADTNSAGSPIDAAGAVIELPPFDSGSSRDRYGRAIDANGALVYVYFDVKKTALGQLLRMSGDALTTTDPLALAKAFDALAIRQQSLDATSGITYTTYSADNPLLDFAWSGLEVFRYRDAPKLLKALAALIDSDNTKAEALMVKVADVIAIIRATPSTSSSSSGSSTALDDLIPLLDSAFEQNGNSASAGRLLFDTFSTEQRRLRNLPMGFARMMKYCDWSSRTPTGPGCNSMMERLLNMMEEADQCDSWPFGNMAELYLNALAGQEKILGITITAETLNVIMDIAWLRQLVCANISEANVKAIAAFAQSGALDAMKPIAKAFADAGEITLLKDILLAMQTTYSTQMRPHEAMIVRVLESGTVELLFEIFDDMNTVTVPGTGEKVSDRIADFISTIVNDDIYVLNRRGNTVKSLTHLLLEPLSELSNRIEARGLQTTIANVTNGLLDVVLQIAIDDNGTPSDASDDKRVLRNHSLVPVTAALMTHMADTMSLYDWRRQQDITAMQADLNDLFTSESLGVLMDVALAIDGSAERQLIVGSITNVLTPNAAARHDIYGSVLEAAAALLQAKSDPGRLVEIAKFVGRAIDPTRAYPKRLVTNTLVLLDGPSGSLLTRVIQNALYKGENGDQASPAEVLLDIFEAVEASETTTEQPLTVERLREKIQWFADFLRDADDGMAWVWDQIARTH